MATSINEHLPCARSDGQTWPLSSRNPQGGIIIPDFIKDALGAQVAKP